MKKKSDMAEIKEIWRLFKETGRRFKETDRKFKDTDRKFKETDRKFKETDRKFKETDRKFKETARRFKELERTVKETSLQIKETERMLFEQNKKLSKSLGELGNRLGQFVQEMVKPALVGLFRSKGIDVYRVVTDMEANRGDDGIQVDLLVVNAKEAIVVECKSKLTIEDVKEHLERIGKFKRFWPEYKDFKLFAAVAGMVVPDEVSKYAYRAGLYVLAQNGEIVEIRNDAKFKPRVW